MIAVQVHGTDTMTVMAAALDGAAGKTIMLVGALMPARFSKSDAAFNVDMAFATAQVPIATASLRFGIVWTSESEFAPERKQFSLASIPR